VLNAISLMDIMLVMKQEGYGRKQLQPILMHYPGICLGALRIIMRIPSQDLNWLLWSDVLVALDCITHSSFCQVSGHMAVMVSYFPLISSLDIWLIFVLLVDNTKFAFGFFLYSLCSCVQSPLIILKIICHWF